MKKCCIISYKQESFGMYGEYSFNQFLDDLIKNHKIDTFYLTCLSQLEYEVYYDLNNEFIPKYPYVKINEDISFINEYKNFMQEKKN